MMASPTTQAFLADHGLGSDICRLLFMAGKSNLKSGKLRSLI